MKRNAFTLVEMLVAIAVLALVTVLIANMMGSVSSAWNRSREKMDNFGKGRALLNLLQQELQNAVLREDLPVFPGGDFAFYTRRMSQDNDTMTDDARPLSFVQYVKVDDSTGKPVLRRIDRPYFYEKNNSPDAPAWGGESVNIAPSASGNLNRQLCEGIYAFRFAFLAADGSAAATFDKTAANPPTAVQVSMVVLSEQAEKFLKSAALRSSFETALGDLPDPAGGQGWSPKAFWDARLLQAGFPARLLTGVRTFERVIPITYQSYDLPSAP